MLKIFNPVLIIIIFFLFSCKKNDSQTQAFLSASVANITLDGGLINAKDSFNIQANVNWSISISPSSATWVSSSISSGNGNGKIFVTTSEANTTNADRVATITLSSPNNSSTPSVTIQIKQSKSNNTIWSKLYGGSGNDQFTDIIKTSDGGYVLTGHAESNNGDLTLNKGLSDFWMLKLDADGSIIWSKTMGGSNYDLGNSVVESDDGGYVFVGVSTSNDGDVIGNHGNGDIWVIKLDINGNLVWKKTYGGSYFEEPGQGKSIIKATGGDFIITGSTQSNDGDVSGNHSSNIYFDVWVLRITSLGNIVWQKCLGGSDSEAGVTINTNVNGDFVLAAFTLSSDGDVTNNYGASDIWIVKLNPNGNILWQKSFGGLFEDGSTSIDNANGGGYLITGSTKSNNGVITGNHGGQDGLILKLDNSGNLIWQKCLGGTNDESLRSLCITSSNSILLTGFTSSNNGDVSGGYTRPDAWLVEIDGNGNKLWQKCVGGNASFSNPNNLDGGNSILSLPNNEFLMLGITTSNDGDVSGNHGSVDGWLYKFRK